VAFTLPPSVEQGIAAVARATNATPFMVVHTVLAVLLARMSGRHDVAIGTPAAGRGAAELDELIGMFVNTLVLRTTLRPAEPFADLLARQRESDLSALAHADLPFERLVDLLAPARTLSHTPLFQIALVFEDTPTTGLNLPGLTVAPYPLDLAVEKFDLTLTLRGAHGGLSFARDLYDEETAHDITRRFVRLLAAAVEAPNTPVGDLPLISEAEHAQLTGIRGAPATGWEPLSRILIAAARHAGALDRPAIRDGDREISYRELHTRSDAWAAALIADGVGPGDLVAVAAPRSLESVLAVWAVAKTGAGFVPVDPCYPAGRVAHMLADSGAVQGLTVSSVRANLPTSLRWRDLDEPLAPGPVPRPHRATRPADVAYVIYTSGSTGTPKGVAVTQAGLAGYCAEQVARYHLQPDSKTLHFASPSFDASVLELLLAVGSGATMVITSPEVYGGPELARLMREQQVTHAFLTPVALASLDPAGLHDLAVVIAGGEACPPDLVRRWVSAHPGLNFVNGYGPTETTIMTNISGPLKPDEPVTIGGPLRGVSEWVLDERLHPVPVGVAGELYIGGAQLARGYHRRADLTAQRFVACPWLPGERMYRTGDVVRWIPSGVAEYLGRNDLQVKLRGFRIELGEIDAVLAEHDEVDFAVTLEQEIGGGAPALVSYVLQTGAARRDTLADAVKAHAQHRLPAHMVPAVIMPLDTLPLTPVGKLDRAALPTPVLRPTGSRPPRPGAESTLAAICRDLLRMDRVGADDSFFALGGDSILAIQLVSRAKAAGLVLRPRDVFEQRTVAALAAVAGTATIDRAELAELPSGDAGFVDQTPAQAAILAHGGPDSRLAAVTVVDLPGALSTDILVAGVAAVLDHHDALRTRLSGTPGAWQLQVCSRGTIDAAAAVTEVVADEDRAATLERAVARLDPRAGAMIHCVRLDAPAHCRVLVAGHRFALDDISWRIVLDDLSAAWSQLAAGQPISLPPVGTSVRRWTHGLRAAASRPDLVAELPYWRRTMATPDPLLGATTFDPAVHTRSTVRRIAVRVPAGVAKAVLTTLPAYYRTGAADPLLAALAVAVRRRRVAHGRTTPRVLIWVTGHGRPANFVPGTDLTRTVGRFADIHPVALDPGELDDNGPGAVLKAVKEQLLAVPNDGIGFGLLRHGNAAAATELATGTGQLGFSYRRIPGDWTELPVAPDPARPAAAALQVSTVARDTADGVELHATFAYSAGLLAEAEVTALADEWTAVLTAFANHAATPDLGRLTPSDVGMPVRQADLDDWARDCPGLVEVWPVTPLQSGLLFHSEIAADTHEQDSYTVQFVAVLDGEVDGERLRRALAALLRRHATLRVVFATAADGTAAQLVVDEVTVPWQEYRADDSDIERLLAEDRGHRFELSHAPLLRLTLYRGRREARLALTIHHILIDGWSMPLLMQDLLALYTADGADHALPAVRPYRDYLAWLSRQDRAESRRVWARLLADAEPAALADALSETSGHCPEGVDAVAVSLSVDETRALTELAHQTGVTVNTVVQAAWGTLIARYTGVQNVAFGATVSGRPPLLDGMADMVGLFINTVPVPAHTGIGTVRELLQRIQRDQVELLDHHYLGLSEIRAAAGWTRLFDSIVAFGSYSLDSKDIRWSDALDGMRVATIDTVSVTHYPLALVAQLDTPAGNDPEHPRLRMSLQYQRHVVAAEAARELSVRLRHVLVAFAADPDALPATMPLLAAPERAQLLRQWQTPRTAGTERTLVDLVARQVARHPDAVAVRAGATLTYSELWDRAEELAAVLTRHGIGPDTLVAVDVDRTLELPIALLGVLRAGGAYLPIDPAIPAQRRDFILADARPVAVLARDAAGSWLVTGQDARTMPAVAATVRPDNLAYTIYTSGSTGVPKGVGVTHRQAVALLENALALFDIGVRDVWTLFHSAAFDFSVWELWGALATGGTVVVVDFLTSRSPDEFRGLLTAEGVTVLSQTPSAFYQLDVADRIATQRDASANNFALRYVIFGGEALETQRLAGWQARHGSHGPRLVNMYGITETTVHVSLEHIVAASAASVIGRALPGLDVFVLDSLLQPAPVAATGELYVAGGQVSRGYLGKPGLTATRFVADPFGAPGTRMYRSGDLGRWHNERLEYAGRGDSQVQLRGFRIELGEVEAALLRDSAVAQAAATVRADDRLIGYVVPEPGYGIDPVALRSRVAGFLPSYMVPNAVVLLDALPLTVNGKLDRKALPAPEFHSVAEFRPPATAIEQLVATVYAEVLGVERVGLDDDFWALGGNSITAVQAVHRLRLETDARPLMQWFFLDPTVAGMAARILDASDTADDAALEVVLPIRPQGSAPPLFCVHPMGGVAWCYAGLVPHVDATRPIYGLQSPALIREELPDTLVELAARYVTEMRAIQPDGPYHLIGWSLGAVIAYEIAVQLRSAGADVALLAMLDGHHDVDFADFRVDVVDVLAEVGLTLGEQTELSVADIESLHVDVPDELVIHSPTRLRRIFRAAMRSIELLDAYQPTPFDGVVQYFRAVQETRDALGPWRPFIREIQDYPIQSTHMQMASPEALAVVGPTLNVLLHGDSQPT
jgi:amino acid adenylation domain-containing protein/non-ribosomal peptide synthase protein (TIGR01720 family)